MSALPPRRDRTQDLRRQLGDFAWRRTIRCFFHDWEDTGYLQGKSCNAPNVPGELALCSSTPGCVVTTPFTTGLVTPLLTTISGLPSPLTSATASSWAPAAGYMVAAINVPGAAGA